jgi:tetratricopeptide (TPR) repeat protein
LAPSDFHAGEGIGPYRLLRPVGRGGMGEVWLAMRSDGQLKRSVALKLPVLSVRRSVLVQRFERERDILAALIHPHIARLYDAGVTDDGQPYMALEYVEGTPITQAADARALDATGRVRLLRQVMDAVQYAHANLVIHRDLKPANVLVTDAGEAKLLDFGIAKLVENEAEGTADSELTRLGGRAMTLRYAAPELLNGGAVSTAVDVWALGVLLYELLAGRRPFDGAGGSLEQQILTQDPSRPSQSGAGAMARLSPSLAGDLDTIALKALKKDPAARYATVAEFADDLDRWTRGEPVRAQRDSPWYRTRRFVGRHRLAVACAALAGVALVGTAAVAVVLGLQAREESARALAARDFMVDIFRRADPDLAQGKEVSAKQLLVQGYHTVLDTMQGQPLLQSELLSSIGLALESMYDLPATDAAYEQAALRYRRAGRLREAAALTVDRAALRLGSQWEVPSATRLLGEAAAGYPRHADDAEFMARLAAYRCFAADIQGDKAERQLWYDRALAHAESGFRDASPRAVLAVRMLAIAEGTMGHADQAVARLDVLLDRLQANPAALPSNTLSVLVDLGAAERRAGRYQKALGRYDAADALCRKSLNAKGSQCVYNQFHRAAAAGLRRACDGHRALPVAATRACGNGLGSAPGCAGLRSARAQWPTGRTPGGGVAVRSDCGHLGRPGGRLAPAVPCPDRTRAPTASFGPAGVGAADPGEGADFDHLARTGRCPLRLASASAGSVGSACEW